MKKIIITISIIAAMLLCFGSAMAAPVDSFNVNASTGKLLVTGSIEACTQYRIVVFDKDKSYDKNATYNDEKIASDILFMTQVPANEDGGYSIYVDMNGKTSGYYTIRVNGEDAQTLYYATAEDKRMFLLNVRIICKKEATVAVSELEELLNLDSDGSDTIRFFMVSDSFVKSADATLIAKCLYEEISEDPTLAANAESFVKTLEKAAHIAALSDGSIKLEDAMKSLTLREEYVEFYNTKLSSEAKKYVSKLYEGKNYTASKAEEAYNEYVALAYINNLGSWADAKYFIEEFGKDFDINASAYKDLSSSAKSDLYDYITDNASKTSLKAFADDVNAEIKDLGKSSGKGSSGGGGGGGGGFSSGTPSGYNPVTPEVASKRFDDMAGFEWAEESVNFLYDKGIVSGVGDGNFAPGKTVTREEMIAMLIRAYGVSVGDADASAFKDVPADSWFAPYVGVAYRNGFINGISNTEFGSGANVTRQDASVMAFNIASAFGKVFPENTSAFADEKEISSYALKAVNALKAAGVINGKGDGTFAPKATCTRAEAAVIISALIK